MATQKWWFVGVTSFQTWLFRVSMLTFSMVAICHSKIAPNNWINFDLISAGKPPSTVWMVSIWLGEFQTYLTFLPPKLMVSIWISWKRIQLSDTPWNKLARVCTWKSMVGSDEVSFWGRNGPILYFQRFCCERSQGMYRILSHYIPKNPNPSLEWYWRIQSHPQDISG